MFISYRNIRVWGQSVIQIPSASVECMTSVCIVFPSDNPSSSLLAVVVHTCIPALLKAEERDLPGLHSKFQVSLG